MTKIQNFLNGKCFVPVVIILVAVIGFCLGRVSGLEEKREPVRVIDNRGNNEEISTKEGEKGEVKSAATSVGTENIVASKNGTKYHYSWCSGAQQISEKNKIYFDSIQAARAAGYAPAANCKGLK